MSVPFMEHCFFQHMTSIEYLGLGRPFHFRIRPSTLGSTPRPSHILIYYILVAKSNSIHLLSSNWSTQNSLGCGNKASRHPTNQPTQPNKPNQQTTHQTNQQFKPPNKPNQTVSSPPPFASTFLGLRQAVGGNRNRLKAPGSWLWVKTPQAPGDP